MKFDCGPSLQDRLKAREKRLSDWHSWFAWHPVRLDDGRCAWLESIRRKGEPWSSFYEAGWVWTYSAAS